MLSNLFAQSGQNVFDESFVHEVRVTFTEPNFWDTLSTNYNNTLNSGAPKVYLIASVEIDGIVVDSVGVRQKGFFSNWGAGSSSKKPLKIDFKEFKNQKFDGLKKINLANGFADPTIMRDALAYHFMRKAGVKAPRTAYAKVYLNNTYWGLYCMVEQVDSEFLEDNYPNSEGNLYKCINNTNLEWQGSNWVSYSDEFALKTNEMANNNTRFIDFVDIVNNTPATNFKDSIENILNVSLYLKILAADVLMYNWDSYYEHGRNFYMYLNPKNNKFNWIPWDYNLAFSSFSTNIIIDYPSPFMNEKPLVKNSQDNTDLRQEYFDKICQTLLTDFNIASLEGYIDSTAALIRPALDLDVNKFYTIQDFDAAIVNDVLVNGPFGLETSKGLKPFLGERMTTVMNELSQYNFNCILGVDDLTKNQLKTTIYPNPFYDRGFTIDIDTDDQVPVNISVYNVLGKLVYNQNYKAVNKIDVDLDNANSGLYLVKIKQGNKSTTKRVIRE